MRGNFPLAGGLLLLAVFSYCTVQFAAPDWLTGANSNNTTIFGIRAEAVVGIGGLVIGFVLRFIWRRRRPEYFRGGTIPKGADGEPLTGAVA